ncbi:MAG: dTMP kinase [Anaerolineales bacterium]|nr:dTMP kinase [Anaerolineales bacterium]
MQRSQTRRGYFITLEGPDGSGKTSQVGPLRDDLQAAGYQVFCTREPGGTSIGDQIRQVLLANRNQEMHPRSEILLFQASRAQLVEEVILPRVAQGQIVLCDRYADSTLAYQGYGHQIDLAQLNHIVNFATGGLKPDLTLLFDVDAQTGLQRRQAEGDVNRLDALALEFHRRVQGGYHALAAAEPQRWVTIDASQSIPAVQAAVRQAVGDWLARQA